MIFKTEISVKFWVTYEQPKDEKKNQMAIKLKVKKNTRVRLRMFFLDFL